MTFDELEEMKMNIWKCTLFALGMALMGTGSADGRVWFVGGPGADFTEIRDAVSVAVDGDLILVRPGDYRGFSNDGKAIIVKASSARFTVGTVTVTSVPHGKSVHLGGFETMQKMALSACGGEVVLDDVEIETSFAPALTIASCQNVAITSLKARSWSASGANPWPTVRVAGSKVRISDFEVYGGGGSSADLHPDLDQGGPGGHGMYITSSMVVLGSGTSVGGIGGGGSSHYDNSNGGPGGNGVHAETSTVIGMGLVSDRFEGGIGGSAHFDSWIGWWLGSGGTGGTGFSSSNGLISRVSTVGGEGGEPGGSEGRAYSGNVVFDPRFPVLSVDKGLAPGANFELRFSSKLTGHTVLMASQYGGFADDSSFDGPPFGVLPGGWYLALPIGRVGPGDLVLNLSVPNDPVVRGWVLHLQGFVVPDQGGASILTNASSRIVGE